MVCKKLMQIKLLIAVLSGQHRTKAFEEFIETIRIQGLGAQFSGALSNHKYTERCPFVWLSIFLRSFRTKKASLSSAHGLFKLLLV